MLCFLPPVPAIRREPRPVPTPQQPARAAQAVILIFVLLNLLFVLTGLLPLVLKMEGRAEVATAQDGMALLCAERRSVGLPETRACTRLHGTER